MTLSRAIEILSKLERTLAPTMAASGTDAIKLGIQALKWRQHDEREVPNWAACPLLGETKESDGKAS